MRMTLRRLSSAKKLRSLISVAHRPDLSCARTHPNGGRHEETLAEYHIAKQVDRRRAVDVLVPTIRKIYPYPSDTRMPRRSDTHRFHWLLRLAPQEPRQIRQLAFDPSARSSRSAVAPNRPHPFAQLPPLLQICPPRGKLSLLRHGNSVPTDSTQPRARIPFALPPASLIWTECPRATPEPGHSPGPMRPPDEKDRKPARFRHALAQDFPLPLTAPDLAGPKQEPCAMSPPHLSNYNRNLSRSS